MVMKVRSVNTALQNGSRGRFRGFFKQQRLSAIETYLVVFLLKTNLLRASFKVYQRTTMECPLKLEIIRNQ